MVCLKLMSSLRRSASWEDDSTWCGNCIMHVFLSWTSGCLHNPPKSQYLNHWPNGDASFQLVITCNQQIQVECLTVSVVAFVVTVDWLHCEAKCQTLPGWNDCPTRQNFKCCQAGLIALRGKFTEFQWNFKPLFHSEISAARTEHISEWNIVWCVSVVRRDWLRCEANSRSFNETLSLYFIRRSVLHELSTSPNEI